MIAKASNDNDSISPKEWTPLELAEMKTGRRLGAIYQAPGFSSRRRIMVKDGERRCQARHITKQRLLNLCDCNGFMVSLVL